MGFRVVISYYDIEGDEVHQRNPTVISRRDYNKFLEWRMDLAAGIKTDVPLPSGFTIEHLYLESPDDVAIQVYKNLSPEYWEVDKVFMAFDCSFQQLALQAASDTEVYLRIGGS